MQKKKTTREMLLERRASRSKKEEEEEDQEELVMGSAVTKRKVRHKETKKYTSSSTEFNKQSSHSVPGRQGDAKRHTHCELH